MRLDFARRASNRIAKTQLVKGPLEFGPWKAIRDRLWRFEVAEYPWTAGQRGPVVEGGNLQAAHVALRTFA
jgi:hypothetical protein